ncbi:hypothetical protein BDD12DRAFT_950044 [Trichophaea hybrida]|nr:hypothetical protein BDD12DRAFT_950044 [Trichophaea hybrida]
MATIGKINPSFISANNETTIALANINFDFSLIKVDPPAEFIGLGNSLSTTRRESAENGLAHTTARKLGALFEDVVPEVSTLVKAYGKRVSEIAASEYNPKGEPQKDGFFSSLVGADGTSIWAAATSGTSAIAVHLLACLLARNWSGSQATAIWSELVIERQKVLKKSANEGEFKGIMSSRIAISRTELADWDASARAWLQTADAAKRRQQTQYKLIVNNIGLAVDVRDHVYDSVSDPLVAPGGLVTIGLQTEVGSQDGSGDGIYWSLPLGNLRYYGDPVQSVRYLVSDASKITFTQLEIVALGSLARLWKFRQQDSRLIASFIVHLHAVLQLDPEPKANWCVYLGGFLNGALHLLDASGLDLKEAEQLFAYSFRRCNHFLLDKTEKDEKLIPPLFGLGLLPFFISALLTEEEKILMLRRFAQNQGLKNEQFVIRYFHTETLNETEVKTWEYCSVNPIDQVGTKRDIDGNPVVAALTYRRWVSTESIRNQLEREGMELSLQDEALVDWDQTERHRYNTGADAKNYRPEEKCSCYLEWRSMMCGGEYVEDIRGSKYDAAIIFNTVSWSRFQNWDSHGYTYVDTNWQDTTTDSIPDETLFAGWTNDYEHATQCIFVCGDTQSAAIYTLQEVGIKVAAPQPLAGIVDSAVDMEEVVTALQNLKLSPKFVGECIENSTKVSLQMNTAFLALSYGAATYKMLPGALIPLSITKRPICQASWASEFHRFIDRWKNRRDTTFSCMLYFLSGGISLSPSTFEYVFAIAAEDSIYASGLLLNDPANRKAENQVRRILGNLGKAGIALLVSPKDPLIREEDGREWKHINHNTFDGASSNSFASSSVHLSFTGYEQSVDTKNQGARDREVYFLESRLSLCERGKWIADLDVLGALARKGSITLLPDEIPCECSAEEITSFLNSAVTIDSWLEFLDPPLGVGVMRAEQNWIARLAGACIGTQRKLWTAVVPSPPACWGCVRRRMGSISGDGGQIVIS